MAIVNFESVAAAAEALQAAGQRASVRAVMAALGGVKWTPESRQFFTQFKLHSV